MIDTIKGYIETTNKSYSDFQHLFINKNKSIKDDGYTISFNLSNFKITIKFNTRDKPIKLYFNGSLPKFYFGNNLAQLDWDTTKYAIQKLSNNLNIDLSEATLTRIDFGFNFIMEKPIHQYISCLMGAPRLKPLRFKESVTFFSKSRTKSIIFYDKLEEIKSGHKTAIESIPEIYHNQNILRYETQLKGLLKQRLEMNHVQIKDLYNDTVQNKLAEICFTEYENVIKLSIGTDPTYLLDERNGLFKYLSYHGAEKLGYDRVINYIYDLKFSVKNPLSKRSKIKHSFDELLKGVKDSTLEENLVSEMNKKITFIQAFI